MVCKVLGYNRQVYDGSPVNHEPLYAALAFLKIYGELN
jgi:hypothetical protein